MGREQLHSHSINPISKLWQEFPGQQRSVVGKVGTGDRVGVLLDQRDQVELRLPLD